MPLHLAVAAAGLRSAASEARRLAR